MDPAAASIPPLSRTPPPCGSKRSPSSSPTNLTKCIKQSGIDVVAQQLEYVSKQFGNISRRTSSSRSEGEASLVEGVEVLTSSRATNLTKYIKQFGYVPAPLLSSDVTSGGSSECEASLVLPGEASLELTVSLMPSLRYDNDDSDADINDLLLPAPLVGELEEDDELQLPAPALASEDLHVRSIVECQSRGPRHVHCLFGEL
jgi:hypothetical protein